MWCSYISETCFSSRSKRSNYDDFFNWKLDWSSYALSSKYELNLWQLSISVIINIFRTAILTAGEFPAENNLFHTVLIISSYEHKTEIKRRL